MKSIKLMGFHDQAKGSTFIDCYSWPNITPN